MDIVVGHADYSVVRGKQKNGDHVSDSEIIRGCWLTGNTHGMEKGASGRPVMLYFRRRTLLLDEVDTEQYC